MSKILSEDIRDILKILNKLEENDASANSPKNQDDSLDTENDENTVDDVDDALTEPADLEKVVGNINAEELIKILNLPHDSIHASNFRSAIAALKKEDPKLTTSQAMALAMAFDHVLTSDIAHKSTLTSKIKGVHGVHEELTMDKIGSYVKKSTTTPTTSTTPSNDVDDMKSMIDAVKKYGTPDEKKDLGLNEQQTADVIGYNSGYGENLASIATDPSRKSTVNVVAVRLSASGKPELLFKDKNGETSVAEWNDKYGWVADFD